MKNCFLLIPIEFSPKSYMMYYAESVSVESQSLLWIPFHKRTRTVEHSSKHSNTGTHTRAYPEHIHCSTEINWNDRIICCRRLFSSNISTLRFALLLYLLLKVNIIPRIWAQDCVLFSLCDRCWYDSCYLFALFSVFILIFGV